MDKETYEYIIDYCVKEYKEVLSPFEHNYVLRKFLESYYSAINKYKEQNNGQEPSSADEKTILSSLMNENTMNSFIDSAKSYYNEYTTSIYNEYQKKANKSSFLLSIGTSVLANFIYSIILVIVFIVAKDQIATWLTSLLK